MPAPATATAISPPAANLQQLASPLNLLGCGLIVLIAANQLEPGRIADTTRYEACAATLALFLAAFLARALLERHEARARAAIALQIPAALGNLWLAYDGFNPILLVLIAAQLPERTSPRRAMVLLIAIDVIVWWLLRDVHQQTRALFSTLLYASFQAFAWLTAYFAFSATRANGELATVNAHLLATRSLLAEGIRNGERLRLSRELHDVAGHALTGLKLHLELAQRLPDPAQREERLEAAGRLVEQLLDDIRGVVGQLRRHDGIALTNLLATACSGFPGIVIDLQHPENLRIDGVDRAETLLRITQEALTNAIRHGHAQSVRVELTLDGEWLWLCIEDNGRGCLMPRAGNGLTGMRERLTECGGALEIDSRPGRGFRVRARLPMQQEPAA